ncbi:MAG: acyl-CoA dehydrogenase [Zetaproteobacteria bacterium]|nr:acyl-CoA dehydrogenase [Pseudobdellovibrionaceae bacterium]
MKINSCKYPDYLEISKKLNHEQKLVEKTVRDFVTKKADPIIVQSYRDEQFPKKLIKEMAHLGILGSNLKGYGLPGLDEISYGLIMKELERCDSGLRSFASVQGSLVMYSIHAFGTEEQKNKWLPLLANGETIGCFGLTESEGGSDPSAMKTTAKLEGKQWVLNGSKMWITNGSIADIAIVWAKTQENIKAFIVPTQTEGFKSIQMSGKLSLRASVTSELYLNNVKIPEDYALPLSDGIKSALSCLNQARYGITWGVLGAAESCFSEVCDYVSQRILFQKPLSTKQLVQVKLSRMLSKITQGQLLAYRLGELKEEGTLHHTHVSLGKQNNCELALSTARICRDMLGGNGIMDEYKTMRHMCNLETVYTYEGTNDIHLLVLGSDITGYPAF